MRKQIIGVATLFTILCMMTFAVRPAEAERPIEFKFAGHVSSIDDDENYLLGAISVGDPFSGTFSYDLDTPITLVEAYYGLYEHFSPPYGISVTINDLTFKTDPDDWWWAPIITNDHPWLDVGDTIDLHSYPCVFPLLDFPTEDQYVHREHHIHLMLEDDSETALSNLDLPTSYNLAQWPDKHELVIYAHYLMRVGGDVFCDIRGEVESISRVPDVGGIWIPVDKLDLLAPWIGLASMISAVAVSVIYVRHRKNQQK